jgi:hypothetical protein
LKVSAELDPGDPDVQRIRSKIARGDLSEMSFSFRATRDKWSADRSKRLVQELTMHTGDVSTVSHGANEATSVSVRGRKGRSAPKPLRRSYVEEAKATRARLRSRRAHPGSEASTDGEEDTPRYTDAEVQKLGEEGKANKRTDGKYNFPVSDRRDLLNAIKAWGRARPSERASVKAFIKARAAVMALEDLLPAAWAKSVPKGKQRSRAGARATGDTEPDADDMCPDCDGTGECANCAGTGVLATESVGGQPQ